MASKRKPAYGAFIVLGIAFMALGASTNVAFLGAGAAFLVLGLAGLKRQGKADG